MTVAKSLAGGLPLSGVVGKAQIMDAPLPGGLGGTYGVNAVACAAALAEAFHPQGSRMILVCDDPEHVAVVPGSLFAPAA